MRNFGCKQQKCLASMQYNIQEDCMD